MEEIINDISWQNVLYRSRIRRGTFLRSPGHIAWIVGNIKIRTAYFFKPKIGKIKSFVLFAVFDNAVRKSRCRFEWAALRVFPVVTWLTVYRRRLVSGLDVTFRLSFCIPSACVIYFSEYYTQVFIRIYILCSRLRAYCCPSVENVLGKVSTWWNVFARWLWKNDDETYFPPACFVSARNATREISGRPGHTYREICLTCSITRLVNHVADSNGKLYESSRRKYGWRFTAGV